MSHRVPAEVTSDIGSLLRDLEALGYRPTESSYATESFGNYHVDLTSPRGWLRLVRDRSQYTIETESGEELRKAGLFRAFNDRNEFVSAVLQWLRAA